MLDERKDEIEKEIYQLEERIDHLKEESHQLEQEKGQQNGSESSFFLCIYMGVLLSVLFLVKKSQKPISG